MLISLDAAKRNFQELLDQLKGADALEFIDWVKDSFSTEVEDESEEGDASLQQIVNELKGLVPVEAVFESESIHWPEEEDFVAQHTAHVDSFLYPCDEDIDELCDAGTLSRNYCLNCGSRNTKPLDFISHSASLIETRFIFKDLLPSLSGKTVLDIGSRLGSVLFSGYFYSNARLLYGIEMNANLCNLQKRVIDQFYLSDRTQIVCDRIENQAELLASVNVIILHNVFQFFLSPQEQIRVWKFLRDNTKSKQILVTKPSLEVALGKIKSEIVLNDWVTAIPVDHVSSKYKNQEEVFEQVSDIFLYEVK